MTLESNLSKVVYNGNGVATEFAFTFKVWDNDQISVTISDPDGYADDVTADATIVLDADAGGTVTYLLDGSPLPSGYKLAITRDMPFLQRVDLISATRFDAQVIEDALDTATAERQELAEKLARAVILPPTSDTTPEQVVEEIFQSRDAAAASASDASDSAGAAADSAALAQAWAESPTPPDADDPDSKSAKTWAGESASSASAASGSAGDASASATLAQAWAESPTPPDPTDPDSKSAKEWARVASDTVPIATTDLAGKVKPDGETIAVTSDGTISATKATAAAAGIVKPDGTTITIDNDGTIHGSSGSNPGELVYSLLPIEDAGLHLLDGSVLSGEGVYADFVDYVASLIESRPSVSNIKKVGSVTDTDGVLSGFSATSYARLPFAFTPGSDQWEIVVKITTGADVATQQIILASHTERTVSIGIDNSKFLLSTGNDTATWSIVNAVSGTYTVLANTTYWVRAKFDSTKYTLEYSLDGEDFTEDISSTSSTVIGSDVLNIGIAVAKVAPALCTVDLSGSYININGSRWWTGTHPAGFMDEAQWQLCVDAYGACGCFVYDSVADTLRLPKATGFIEGTVNPAAVGSLVEAGLPNITGMYDTKGYAINWAGSSGGQIECTGAFYGTNNKARNNGSVYSGYDAPSILNFDASLSNSIYGNSTTVQPQAIRGFIYMVVANRTKTEIEADIDGIAADLQLKADVDLGNVTSPGNVRMAHAAMPSSQKVAETLPANGGTIVARDDGYLVLAGNIANAGMYVMLTSSTGVISACGGGSSTPGRAFVPVTKGDIVTVSYTVGSANLNFVYANGNAPV